MASVAIAVGVSVVGGLVSSALAPKPPERNQIGDDLSILKSEYGTSIPKVWGKARVTGNIIWGNEITQTTWGGGGKNDDGSNARLDGTFAVLLGEGPIDSIGRIWLNDEIWYNPFSQDQEVLDKSNERLAERTTVYLGTSTQLPDPVIVVSEGAGNVPGFRNQVYIVFRDLGLEKYGGRIPKVEVELVERSSTLRLSDVLEGLCEKAGLTPSQYSIALSDNPAVSGFVYQQSGKPPREAIEDLQNIYLFQVIDDGTQVLFQDQELPIIYELEDFRLCARQFNSGSIPRFVETVEKLEDLPSKIEVEYKNPNNAYARGIQSYYKATANHINDLNFSTNAAIDDSQAQTAAARLIELYYGQARKYKSVMLSHMFFNLRAGDTLTLPVRDQRRQVQIERITRGTNFVAELDLMTSTKNIKELEVPSDIVDDYNPQDGFDIRGNPDTEVIDTHILYDEDNSFGLYATVLPEDPGAAWLGGTLYTAPLGGNYIATATIPIAAATGTLDGELPLNFDNVINEDDNGFIVDLDINFIDSVDDATFQAFGNIIYIDGELITYQTATLIATNKYRLTNIVRGIRGTEQFISAHSTGSKVFFLKTPLGNFTDVEYSVNTLGQDLEFKTVPVNFALQDVTETDTEEPFQGLRLKPYAPTSPYLVQDSTTGDLTFSFQRRTRLQGDWLPNSETVPLNEDVEEYEVEIYDGASLVETLTINTNSFTYTAAQQTAGFGSLQNTLNVKIYQMSVLFGRGYPLEINKNRDEIIV